MLVGFFSSWKVREIFENNQCSTVTGYSINNSPEFTFSLLVMEDLIIVTKVRVGNKISSAFLYFPLGTDSWGVFPGHNVWLYFYALCFSNLLLGILLQHPSLPFNFYLLQDRAAPIIWTCTLLPTMKLQYLEPLPRAMLKKKKRKWRTEILQLHLEFLSSLVCRGVFSWML